MDKLKLCYDDTLVPWSTEAGAAAIDAPLDTMTGATVKSNNRSSKDDEENHEEFIVQERPKRSIRKPRRFDQQ